MRHSVLGKFVLMLATISEDFLGSIFDLLEKLSGKNGAEWFEEFKKFLRKENPWGTTVRKWKIWKTIKLGTGLKTALQFSQAFEAYGYKISNWAKDMMTKTAFMAASAETEVDLVVVSVAELGFKDGACFRDIYARAIEWGLSLCPAEVGPQLRLQYKDQPEGEWLRIAMEAVTGSDDSLDLFKVVRYGDELWLDVVYGGPGDVWRNYGRFVFARRK